MKIIDGESYFNVTLDKYLSGKIWTAIASRRGVKRPSLNDVSEDNPTYVHISHGRALASCPSCNSAEYVWLNGPLLMACANCGNADIQGKMRQVIVPSDFLEITNALLRRPNPQTQNWFPGVQSLDDILAENEENGVY